MFYYDSKGDQGYKLYKKLMKNEYTELNKGFTKFLGKVFQEGN